jgi:hypothetical protein
VRSPLSIESTPRCDMQLLHVTPAHLRPCILTCWLAGGKIGSEAAVAGTNEESRQRLSCCQIGICFPCAGRQRRASKPCRRSEMSSPFASACSVTW